MEIQLNDGRDVAGALAAVMGAIVLFVGLVLVLVLARRASSEARREQGLLRQRFDDAWWALRQAAVFVLAVMTLGAILLLVPALSPPDPDPEASPTPSVEPSEPAESGSAEPSASPTESATADEPDRASAEASSSPDASAGP